jgi:hypothetical protein
LAEASPPASATRDSMLGLELRPETTIEKAETLARILNVHVAAISLT